MPNADGQKNCSFLTRVPLGIYPNDNLKINMQTNKHFGKAQSQKINVNQCEPAEYEPRTRTSLNESNLIKACKVNKIIKEYPETHLQKFCIRIHKETIQLIKMHNEDPIHKVMQTKPKWLRQFW
uniref:Uncharacterized protein n=1 Tax=Manihot esculenta TaxID=3983 RepID=A0A2C9U3H2_MANES